MRASQKSSSTTRSDQLGLDDDYPERSSTPRSARCTTLVGDAPVLEEVLDSLPLFRSFLKYTAAQYASENLLFLKQATMYARLRRPHNELHREALRLVWSFVAEAATTPVNISSDNRTRLEQIFWDYEGKALVDNHIFDASTREIRALIDTDFRNWLACPLSACRRPLCPDPSHPQPCAQLRLLCPQARRCAPHRANHTLCSCLAAPVRRLQRRRAPLPRHTVAVALAAVL